MNTIEVFGPAIASIIRVLWFVCGISFSFWAYKSTTKFDFGLVILSILGPMGWLFVGSLYLFKPIVKKYPRLESLSVTVAVICSVTAILIPSYIITKL